MAAIVTCLRQTPFTNQAIASRLRCFARLLEIRSEDYYRIRAYDEAAGTIEDWPASVSEIATRDGIKGVRVIPGVGRSIGEKIIELVNSGTFQAWDEITTETPISVLDLLTIPGIGSRTSATLHQKFKITSLYDLALFTEGGGLDLVDGLDERRASQIRESLARLYPGRKFRDGG